MIELIISVLLVTVIILGMNIERYKEKKYWNKGVCKKCSGKYECFDCDSANCRGYECNKCGYKIWISYNVDK